MGAYLLTCNFPPNLYVPVVFLVHFTLLDVCFMVISCLVYSSALEMKVIYTSETLVGFQQTSWHYITEEELFIATAVRS